jgi:hypothetical protein
LFIIEDDRREKCVQDLDTLRFSINSIWSTVSELPPESKANAQTITKSGGYVHFAHGSHFGEEQGNHSDITEETGERNGDAMFSCAA